MEGLYLENRTHDKSEKRNLYLYFSIEHDTPERVRLARQMLRNEENLVFLVFRTRLFPQ
jgi:hypothetical protein